LKRIRTASIATLGCKLNQSESDRMMRELDNRFPQYAFASHKGYCTPEHDAALAVHGPCGEHRFSFVNVRQAASRRAGPAGVPDARVLVGQDGGMPEFATADLPADLEVVA